MKVVAVLLAGGVGKRFGEKKQFIKIKGESLFQYSLNTLNKLDFIDQIILVLPEEDLERVNPPSFIPLRKVAGGKERQDSVYNALKSIDTADIVVIHDTARPFATEKMFKDAVDNVKKGWDGSITGYYARDTIKEVKNKKVIKTLKRDNLFIVQTPQAFSFEKLLNVHERAKQENLYGTDDAFLMEHYGYNITINQGSVLNLKITTKEDLILANCIVKKSP